MNDTEDQIGKIESTYLGIEDHGVFTCYLYMSYGGSCQGVGGYSLDGPRRDAEGKFVGRFGTAYGMEFIRRLMAACGVEAWEKLAGRTVFIIRKPGWNGRVLGVKPLPTEKGEPFLFDDLHGFTDAP